MTQLTAGSNPMDPISQAMAQGPSGWPLAAIHADALAHQITSASPRATEPIWINGQMGLLTVLILLAADQAPPATPDLGSVLATLHALGGNEGAALVEAIAKLPADHPARRAYGPLKSVKSKARASFLVAANAALHAFADRALTA